MERELIASYEAQMRMIAQELTPDNLAVAIELASLPAQVRGFGHIKEANLAKVRAVEPQILAKFKAAASREAAERPSRSVA
jgi:indolepyruvate ferredoxin oxidoreductase